MASILTVKTYMTENCNLNIENRETEKTAVSEECQKVMAKDLLIFHLIIRYCSLARFEH